MTWETACGEFRIEKPLMRYFADNGIVGCGELDDGQLKAVGLIVLFLKAGLTKENIVRYFKCDDTCDGKCDKARMLRTLRENMLDEIHDRQKQLDKIDYGIHELQSKN